MPAALVVALLLEPVLRRDMQVHGHEGGVLLLAFAAWVESELRML